MLLASIARVPFGFPKNVSPIADALVAVHLCDSTPEQTVVIRFAAFGRVQDASGQRGPAVGIRHLNIQHPECTLVGRVDQFHLSGVNVPLCPLLSTRLAPALFALDRG